MMALATTKERREFLEAAFEAADDAASQAWRRLSSFWNVEYRKHCKRKGLCERCGKDKTQGIKRTWSMQSRGGKFPDMTHDPVRNRWVRKMRALARRKVKRANFQLCPSCRKARHINIPERADLVDRFRQDQGCDLVEAYREPPDWPED